MKEDFKLIDKVQNDQIISTINTTAYKSHIKSSVKHAALKYLKQKPKNHKKVKHIQYNK